MENIKKCRYCKKLFEKKINCSRKKWETMKCCSLSCAKKGVSPWNKGVPMEEKQKLHLHKVLLGKTCNTGRTHFKKGFHPSKLTEFKPGQESWLKGKKNPHFTRENNPRWKGGIYPEHLKVRHSPEMKRLTREALKRDNRSCKDCEIRNVKLFVHHIKPFSIYPELRLEINNLITLCHKCHKRRHSTI